jgi:hypothetical protein
VILVDLSNLARAFLAFVVLTMLYAAGRMIFAPPSDLQTRCAHVAGTPHSSEDTASRQYAACVRTGTHREERS